MILLNSTNALNNDILTHLYDQLASDEGITSTPLGIVTFTRLGEDIIEATFTPKNFGRLD